METHVQVYVYCAIVGVDPNKLRGSTSNLQMNRYTSGGQRTKRKVGHLSKGEHACLEELIARGEERGFLTFAQISTSLAAGRAAKPQAILRLIRKLESAGVPIVDTEKAPQGFEGQQRDDSVLPRLDRNGQLVDP